MSSNGVWIADATGDTMANGSGLNPSAFTNNWPYGIPFNMINVFLPYPGDSTKYVLIHKTLWGILFPEMAGLYRTVVDLNLNGGLGWFTNCINFKKCMISIEIIAI